MTNLREIYEKAYKLALENASDWLDVAKSALDRKYFGQAYSIAIIAFEEIGKSWISWLASEELIPFDDEILHDVYRYHETKTLISLIISASDALYMMIGAGFIDSEEILKELVLVSEEEAKEATIDALQELASHSEEIEFNRRAGMYVDLRKGENGKSIVTSPRNFDEKRSRSAFDEVKRTYDLLNVIDQVILSNIELKRSYVNFYRQIESETDSQ